MSRELKGSFDAVEASAPRKTGSMLPAVIYSIVLCIALIAGVEQDIGWRPPFVRVWDARAAIYFAYLCAGVALVAGLILGVHLRSEKASPRFRGMPVYIGMVPVFVLVAGQRLSPASKAGEVFSTLSVALALGVGVAAACGFVASFGGNEDAKPLKGKALHTFAAIIIGGMLAVASILLLPLRAVDNGKFETIAEFGSSDLSLRLILAEPPATDTKFGRLEIENRGAVNTLTLEKGEWASLIELWSRAKGSAASQWHMVGEIHESDVADPTHLSINAGPEIRFSLTSQRDPSVVFELPLSDISRFDAAIRDTYGRLLD